MKLEEGMYIRIIDPVRTICTGIGKVLKIAQDTIYAKVNNIELPVAFEKRHIVKASNNIIDLIEVGDFITYSKDNLHIEYPCGVWGKYDKKNKETVLMVEDKKIEDITIKSILTKEQFKTNKFDMK